MEISTPKRWFCGKAKCKDAHWRSEWKQSGHCAFHSVIDLTFIVDTAFPDHGDGPCGKSKTGQTVSTHWKKTVWVCETFCIAPSSIFRQLTTVKATASLDHHKNHLDFVSQETTNAEEVNVLVIASITSINWKEYAVQWEIKYKKILPHWISTDQHMHAVWFQWKVTWSSCYGRCCPGIGWCNCKGSSDFTQLAGHSVIRDADHEVVPCTNKVISCCHPYTRSVWGKDWTFTPHNELWPVYPVLTDSLLC